MSRRKRWSFAAIILFLMLVAMAKDGFWHGFAIGAVIAMIGWSVFYWRVWLR